LAIGTWLFAVGHWPTAAFVKPGVRAMIAPKFNGELKWLVFQLTFFL
jgi:hypothetical protein